MQQIKNLLQFCLDLLNEHFWIIMAIIFFALDDTVFAAFSFAMACYVKLCDLVEYFYAEDDSETVEDLASKGNPHVGG